MSGIQVEHRDGAAILTPTGSLVGGDTTEVLENAVEQALRDSPSRLVFDFVQIDHINSIGMATVIRTHATCRKQGVPFYVINASQKIRDVFEITRISTLGILRDTFEDTQSG